VDTCWYNPHHAVNDRGVRVDYEIDKIEDLLQLI
jgi:FMN phosphatase YigB (HAD superfamily)